MNTFLLILWLVLTLIAAGGQWVLVWFHNRSAWKDPSRVILMVITQLLSLMGAMVFGAKLVSRVGGG